MRITHPRAAFVCFLLLAFNGASAGKLRGTRTRRVNQDKLLFTEGARKGGDEKTNVKEGEPRSEDNWKSGSGNSYDDAAVATDDYDDAEGGNAAAGGEKQKGETIYDRSPMKFSREGDNSVASKQGSIQRDSKQGSKMADNKGGSTKNQANKDQGGKDKESETMVHSFDDVEGDLPPPHEDSARETERSKGASKGEPGDPEDEGVYDEAYDEYDEQEPGKVGGKEEDDEGTTPAPMPGQAPISAPDRNMPPDYTQMQQMAQVAYVLSPFGLEYTLANPSATGVPTTTTFAEVEAATIAYLEEYIALTYNADAMIEFASAELEATSRRTGGSGGTPFIDYEASVAFVEDSPMTPSPSDIGTTLSEAFQEPNLSTYLLNLASRLSTTNPFLSTTLVTVYVPDTYADGPGRVARSPPKMPALGMVAAAGAGVLTLIVAGYLILKIRSENADMKDKFGKGFVGGHTLAGDTYDNSTLRHDDGQSLDNTYNDDGSFLSSPPPATVLNPSVDNSNLPHIRTFDQAPREVGSKIVGLDNSPMTEDGGTMEDGEDKFHDEEPVRRNGDAQDQTRLASMVGRTRALVPTFKSSHMSNTDIKKYFKSKYKCGSPQGYAVVDEAAIGGVEASPSDDQSLNLVLPALDHHGTSESPQQTATTEVENSSEAAKRQPYQDYEGAYMRAYDEQSLASSNPSDEGTRADHDSVSVSDSVSGIGPSVHRLVATAQRGHQKTAAMDPHVVPRLPNEQRASYDNGERHMDDVSLGTM